VEIGVVTASVGVVEGAGIDVGVGNVVAGAVNAAVGVGVTVLPHPASISPANNRSNKSDKGFLFMGQLSVAWVAAPNPVYSYEFCVLSPTGRVNGPLNSTMSGNQQ
jgi:hypothetical protein